MVKVRIKVSIGREGTHKFARGANITSSSRVGSKEGDNAEGGGSGRIEMSNKREALSKHSTNIA